MELVGEEKRIQALFRELRLEDERVAMPFAVAPDRAGSRSIRPLRAFKLSFVAMTLLLLCSLVSLALWAKYVGRTTPPNAVVDGTIPTASPIAPIPTIPLNSPKPDESLTAKQTERHSFKAFSLMRARRAAMLAARQAEIRQAAAISRWQSPTNALMSSSVDEVFTSLPQLNENANELKSFLPSSPR